MYPRAPVVTAGVSGPRYAAHRKNILAAILD